MDKRQKERYSANLPVQFDTGSGIARDISASGIYIETDRDIKIGSRLSMSIDMDTDGGMLRMECEALIARIEPVNGRHGVGARILQSTLKAID